MKLKRRNQVEEQLRLSEQRFRELFNKMTNGVLIFEQDEKDNSFRVVDMNPSVKRIFGVNSLSI